MARIRITWFYLILALLHVLERVSNANPPIIHYSHNMRILKIPSHIEPGTVVYRIKATDADNENVFFDVLEEYGKSILRFDMINHNEANVVLISPLHESDEFNLTIFATDNQESTYIESRLIATSVPEVQQAYLNPILLHQNPIYVNENETLNRSIATVRVYEREDSKLPVTFELMENTDLFDFHYVFGPRGMSTAELVLIDKLDFEQQTLYILTVLAINAQTNEEVDTRNVHSVRLSIVVQDVQDSPPVFSNLPQVVSIGNDHQLNAIIYNVTAHDGDTVNRRNITFSILEPNKEYFRIANNGSVYLTKSPDELRDAFSEHKPVQVDIQASEIVIEELMTENEPLSSVSQLLVRLISANRPPHFKANHLLGSIEEHSAHKSAVSWQSNDLAHVMDLDEGLNGTIELELLDPHGTFTIEPISAYREAFFTLLVNNSSLLDFETKSNISVMIIAKDKSEIPMVSNVTCTILIEDINDHYPQFSEQMYESIVYENAQEGTSIAQIFATDKDAGDYGQVRFTELKGIFAKNLEIDAVSGVVRLINSSALDRELVAEYVVTVEARDNLGRGNLNTTQLHIRVLDVNDNPPIFLQPFYLALLNDNLTDFVHSLQITAIDIDEVNTPNSMVNYEILQGNYEGLFDIDKHSGKVTVKPATTRDRRLPPNEGNITLTVRAYDLGIPQMSSTSRIFVYPMNRQNRLSTVRALFLSKKKFNSLQGNESLERYLGDITGGNVTINEVKATDTAVVPNSIIASVQYRNETTLDLDAIANAFDRLVERNGDHLENNKHFERETETEIVPKAGNVDQSASHQRQVTSPATIIRNKNQQQDEVSSRQVHTSQLGNLDLLLWIMILLILFLLVVLIFLLCLLCKGRKRQSKTSSSVSQTEITAKSIPAITKPIVRAKRRRARQVRNTQLMDVRKPVDQVISVALEEPSKFDVEEEKKYATTTTDNVVTYYEYKRLRYPKSEVNTTNVLTLDRVDVGSSHQPEQEEQELEDGRFARRAQSNAVTTEDAAIATDQNTTHYGPNQPQKVTTALAVIQRHDSAAVQLEAYPKDNFAPVDLENMHGSYKNLQRKSIFSITYDRINSRENISAGSEKTS